MKRDDDNEPRAAGARGAAKDAWIFLVCGENERERRFAEGALREACERGIRRVEVMGHEGDLGDILVNADFRRCPFSVVGYVHDGDILRGLERRAVPCVLFGKADGAAQRRDRVVCATDNRAIGRMAADYFAGQRRYAAAAYVMMAAWREREGWARERRDAFEAALRGHGIAYAGAHALHVETYSPIRMRDRFASFAAPLPKPLAIFGCNDLAARHAALCCAELGLRIPDDVAILGADDDPALCETAPVAISSVALETVRLGRRAMALAEQMLRGERPETTTVLCPPSHVAERASTSAAPLADLFVGKAVDFISAHAREPIGVADVVAACGTSRRFLEKRVKSLTGRTILETIHEKRLGAVVEMLRDTDVALAAISDRLGFSTPSSLGSQFRRRFGRSMREYRAELRSLT